MMKGMMVGMMLLLLGWTSTPTSRTSLRRGMGDGSCSRGVPSGTSSVKGEGASERGRVHTSSSSGSGSSGGSHVRCTASSTTAPTSTPSSCAPSTSGASCTRGRTVKWVGRVVVG